MPRGVYVRTKAHRKALSSAHIGQKSWIKGKHHTKETRQKISSCLRKLKDKECKICHIVFRPSGDYSKFCSRACFNKHLSISRGGRNNPAYRNGYYSFGQTITTTKHNEACRKYREDFVRQHGYVFCEICKTSNSFKFEVHHIYYASRFPKHRNLHDRRNLILVCIQHHNDLHGGKLKTTFQQLEQERGLKELFQ